MSPSSGSAADPPGAPALHGEITTEIRPVSGELGAGPFVYAEGYHQHYLHENPGGYCPINATGVRYAG